MLHLPPIDQIYCNTVPTLLTMMATMRCFISDDLEKKRKSKLQGALTRREAILGEARILGFRKVRLMMKLDKTKKQSKKKQL